MEAFDRRRPEPASRRVRNAEPGVEGVTDVPAVEWTELSADPVGLRRGEFSGLPLKAPALSGATTQSSRKVDGQSSRATLCEEDKVLRNHVGGKGGETSDGSELPKGERMPLAGGRPGGLILRWAFLLFCLGAWAPAACLLAH